MERLLLALQDGVTVKVIPNASVTEIVSFIDGVLKLRVKASPEKGKANAEIVRFFKKSGVRVEIVHGASSRTKLVRRC